MTQTPAPTSHSRLYLSFGAVNSAKTFASADTVTNTTRSSSIRTKRTSWNSPPFTWSPTRWLVCVHSIGTRFVPCSPRHYTMALKLEESISRLTHHTFHNFSSWLTLFKNGNKTRRSYFFEKLYWLISKKNKLNIFKKKCRVNKVFKKNKIFVFHFNF